MLDDRDPLYVLEAAWVTKTPGPWAEDPNGGISSETAHTIEYGTFNSVLSDNAMPVTADVFERSDAEFIAAAGTHVGTLLARLHAAEIKADRLQAELARQSESISAKVYEIVKFVNPRAMIDVLNGMAVHAVAGSHGEDAHGIIRYDPEQDDCIVSFYDVLTDEETFRRDIRSFVEIIVL